MPVPRGRAGGCWERGRSCPWCPTCQGDLGGGPALGTSSSTAAVSTSGTSWLGEHQQHHLPPHSPHSHVLLALVFLGLRIFRCLCTGARGQSLHLQNKPPQGGAALRGVPAVANPDPSAAALAGRGQTSCLLLRPGRELRPLGAGRAPIRVCQPPLLSQQWQHRPLRLPGPAQPRGEPPGRAVRGSAPAPQHGGSRRGREPGARWLPVPRAGLGTQDPRREGTCLAAASDPRAPGEAMPEPRGLRRLFSGRAAGEEPGRRGAAGSVGPVPARIIQRVRSGVSARSAARAWGDARPRSQERGHRHRGDTGLGQLSVPVGKRSLHERTPSSRDPPQGQGSPPRLLSVLLGAPHTAGDHGVAVWWLCAPHPLSRPDAAGHTVTATRGRGLRSGGCSCSLLQLQPRFPAAGGDGAGHGMENWQRAVRGVERMSSNPEKCGRAGGGGEAGGAAARSWEPGGREEGAGDGGGAAGCTWGSAASAPPAAAQGAVPVPPAHGWP